VHPDRGAVAARAKFHQVTDLTDEPETVSAVSARRWAAAAGERIGNDPLVSYLAHDFVVVVPDREDARRLSVAERVGGYLADRQHQVIGP
jgi:hypothetical protein